MNKKSNYRPSRSSGFSSSKPKSYGSSSRTSSGPKKFGSSTTLRTGSSTTPRTSSSSFSKSPSSYKGSSSSGEKPAFARPFRSATPWKSSDKSSFSRNKSFRSNSSSFGKTDSTTSSFKPRTASTSNGAPTSYQGNNPGTFRPRPSFGGGSSSGPRKQAFGSNSFRPSSNRSHGGRSSSFGGKNGGGGRVQKTFNPSQFINKNVEETVEHVPYKSMRTFTDFQLNEKLTEAILKAGLVTPTEIQDQIIPHILANQDVVGLANTGTGKTAAFLIPLIDKALRFPDRQVLVLAPTRELAIQIEQELKKLTFNSKIYSVICVGGTSLVPQIKILKNKNQFIIGTPGRVLDLMKRRAMNANAIQAVVLDEADRMLDMGFIHDIRAILKDMPQQRETLFFSATMSPEITKLVDDFLRDPIKISVRKKDVTTNIEQDVVHFLDEKVKINVLIDLLKKDEFSKVLIFGKTKHGVEKLSKDLSKVGLEAESIHGNKSHPQRQRALKRFKEGGVNILVATDVAARGIHVDDISHVINYDLPPTYEDYVHRIGRTGRAAKRGKALTFIR
ncbi:MAG: DEAD/DEAH box helicase [Candidatus Pacebacteria bacterium]|jgi:superfamily II DNA/RNA helicase|nr:DEAD/DEAH box helicase [Candidatus Paceibacterota bacterium]